ncbi:cytochrome c oxidase cbb3-type subunit 3 [Catalinimonas alkaloidigena]|uniref:Cytochrome c oxidase cbb3-type subunit 3 n=2 Tax=Catalinimonas alkaloidigena TaxID=1075417 RepID=A0A1G8WC01_9BACT|nr:cytochrome c oxidase cbb3-type subunit 3 [Catalinimonas alkaloidigena]
MAFLALGAFGAGALNTLQAQDVADEAARTPVTNDELMLWLLIGLMGTVVVLVLWVAVYMLVLLQTALQRMEGPQMTPEGVVIPPKTTWTWLKERLTDAVPVERESAILLDHNYDGIRELDNHLPPWWKWGFYFSIVFAAVYVYLYHVADALPLSDEEYRQEVAVAEAQAKAYQALLASSLDETNVEATADANELEHGATLFKQNCAACHGQAGEGGVGPNLTDVYWLHGGSVGDVFATIKYGIPEKGMISWQSKLTPADIRDVASYILMLQGTDPPNAKEPQGDKYTPQESDEVATQASL